MVDDKNLGEDAAAGQSGMSKAASDRPEAEEFYSEIRAHESVIEMPDGEQILTRSVEEEEIGPVNIKGNSKAFEEEMDDL